MPGCPSKVLKILAAEEAFNAANEERGRTKLVQPFEWTGTDGRVYSIAQIMNCGPRPAGDTRGRDGYLIEVRGDNSKSEIELIMANGGVAYKESVEGEIVPWRELSLEGAVPILKEVSRFLVKISEVAD